MDPQDQEAIRAKRDAIRTQIEEQMHAAVVRQQEAGELAMQRPTARARSSDGIVQVQLDQRGFIDHLTFAPELNTLDAPELRESVLEAIHVAQQELRAASPRRADPDAILSDTRILDQIRELLPEEGDFR